MPRHHGFVDDRADTKGDINAVLDRGYTASYSHLARFLAPWRSGGRSEDGLSADHEAPAPLPLRVMDPMTGRRISPLVAAALCVKPRCQMTTRQIGNVDGGASAGACGPAFKPHAKPAHTEGSDRGVEHADRLPLTTPDATAGWSTPYPSPADAPGRRTLPAMSGRSSQSISPNTQRAWARSANESARSASWSRRLFGQRRPTARR